MDHQARTTASRAGWSAGRRDLLVVLVAVAILCFGLALGVFDHLWTWLDRHSPVGPGDLLAIALVVALGLGAMVVGRRRANVELRDDPQQDAQARLREAEERYRYLVENLPVVTYICDVSQDGTQHMRYAAPSIVELSGYEEAEWTADPGLWERLIHPAEREQILGSSREADVTGAPFDVEYRLMRKDGRVVWVHDRALVVGSQDGVVVWQGVLQDITVRRHTQQRLHQAEERFRTLVEQVPVVTYIEDPVSKRLLYVSPQIVDMFGYTQAEWQQDPAVRDQRLHPEDRDRVRDARSDDRLSVDHRSIRRDGSVVWVHDEAALVRDEQGVPLFWQGAIFDITERKGAEERLREAEERYRTLVEQLPVVVYMEAVDDLSTALYISPQYERITGYPAERRLAEPELWVSILHPDDRERVLAESLRTNQTGDPFDIEYRIVRADGRTVWVHDHALMVLGPDGKHAWQGLLIDINERTLALEALDRRDRILEAAGHAAERFLQAPRWSYAIEDVLARLGEAGGAGRVFVYENGRSDAGDLITSLAHEWRDPEQTPAGSSNSGITFEPDTFGRWAQTLGAGDVIHGPVREYPAMERAILESRGIGSCIVAPVFVDEGWWGSIGFDHHDERAWQPAEIDAVRVAANTLGAAIGRERAAQRLAETERRYRTLVEQIPAVTYMQPAGPDDEPLYISPQVEAMMGYPLTEWDHSHWLGSLHPDDRDRVLAEDARTDRTGEPFSIEYRMLTRDGRVLWVHDEAVLLRDAAGAPAYWQGVRFNITEQRAAQDQHREAEARYRGLIETIPAATYIDTVDVRSQAVYMSPQVEQIYGYTPEEWRTKPELWEQGIHPEDRDEVVRRVDQHNRESVPYQAEYRFRHRDGRWVWVRDEAVMILDADGRPRFSQGVVFDITAQKQNEEQLRDAEERFRAIVEHVPSAIYLDKADATMESLYISPQIEQMTGVTPQEWMEDPELWLELAEPEDREAVRDSYVSAATAREPWSYEYRMRTRDGRSIWVHDETTFLHDEAGNPTFMQGVISDITERKLAEQALRESEQREREAAERLRALDEMKNTFLAAVSHELRSPLTSILGLSLTLERTPDMEDTDRDDLLSRVSSNARKLDRLLKDLLDIDRLNRGIVEPQYRATDVGALARRTVESLDSLADRAVVVEADSVVLPADPAKVERIIENLLMNAARHTTTDRRIWLRVRPDHGGVLIAVEDDGPGVPPELHEAIFEAFRQGPTASPHSPGTGIGLSLVARFASLHGGRAWVQERGGGGASFRVFLPAGPAEDAGGEGGGAATSVGGRSDR